MNKSFRAILPADPSHESVSRPLYVSSGDAATTPPPEWALKKRRRESRRAAAILVACNNCRQRKTRCDGRRPFCSGCASRKLQCCYVSSNVDETPHRALERRIESLQGHLRDRDELLERLRSAPDEEALDVLRRLRRTSDVSSALSSLAGSATGLDPPLPDMLQLQRSVSPPAYDAVDFGLDALQEPTFPSWDVSDSSTMDLNWLFATQDQWPTSPE